MIVLLYQIVLTVCFHVVDQVLHRIKGSVLWLEASRSLREDTAQHLVSLNAKSVTGN